MIAPVMCHKKSLLPREADFFFYRYETRLLFKYPEYVHAVGV